VVCASELLLLTLKGFFHFKNIEFSFMTIVVIMLLFLIIFLNFKVLLSCIFSIFLFLLLFSHFIYIYLFQRLNTLITDM